MSVLYMQCFVYVVHSTARVHPQQSVRGVARGGLGGQLPPLFHVRAYREQWRIQEILIRGVLVPSARSGIAYAHARNIRR